MSRRAQIGANGGRMSRIYLDHNATTPLRVEARDAMIAAMDVLGNPSSVHFEGRAAKALLEKARADLSESVGASGNDLVFTSGATEAAAMALKGRGCLCAEVEHPSVMAHCEASLSLEDGKINDQGDHIARQLANSETGVLQKKARPVWFEDAVQAFGKIPYAFSWRRAKTGAISAHKFGGPKGIGALLLDASLDLTPLTMGGGQEGARRAGTENILGAVGMAAAAKAALVDLDRGVWEQVAELRDRLEDMLLNECADLIIAGKDMDRLPNTSNFAVAGWKGETQVMQMDLAGFAVSAGSACSSGKVRESAALRAMGFDPVVASSAIRVSLSPQNTLDELESFAKIWLKQYQKWREKAA